MEELRSHADQLSRKVIELEARAHLLEERSAVLEKESAALRVIAQMPAAAYKPWRDMLFSDRQHVRFRAK